MVRIAIKGDSRVLAEMAVQMWDSHTVDELEAEFVETLNDKQPEPGDTVGVVLPTVIP